MRFFLKDFPDLEEAAIDAIYDLCEDSSAQVRPLCATYSFFRLETHHLVGSY